MEEVTYLPRLCPRCGKALAAAAPEGLCPACLLLAGTETLTQATLEEALTVTARGGAVAQPTDTPRLTAGQTWGSYRIGRLLGRGGMGEVHEAEHIETGRRIALKILHSRLHDADDRARFLREGQLAASVSHPHTVYIFGSDEIAGGPVISMELLPGGTLKDRVTAEGPLPPAVAVSAVLDIIGGLDAAHAAGILHRDIKPSNCFVDGDGSVKVGDFGLSISTLARDVHQQLATGFEGTPQFAAPEQLRGEPLDVRADIYAVGATLYYLLTGRPPFDARDLRELVERVTTEPPTSPRVLRWDIPQGLAAVVMRCLAKAPSQRPPSYTALAEALRPYSVLDERSAALGPRLLAAVVDLVILAIPVSVWTAANGNITVNGQTVTPATNHWTWLLNVVYFFVCEARWGASLGKRLFGLQLSSPGSVGWTQRVARRTFVFHLPWLVIALLLVSFGPIGPASDRKFGVNITLNAKQTRDGIENIATLTLIAALFLTARLHNGWSGLHDLTSATRVVSRTATGLRKRTSPAAAPAIEGVRLPSRGPRYGPFSVVSDAGTDARELVVGFDPVLRRRVWIHLARPQTPAIDATRRNVSRAGRLHWLTGRRSATEDWDAFEAPDGRALLSCPGTDWATLKIWLLDLAAELTAAAQDGSTPQLRLDRVWIRDDGRLVLLDYPAPDLDATACQRESADLTAVALLSAVATHGLSRSSSAHLLMPLSARVMLTQWSHSTPPALNEARADLVRVAARPDQIWRPRRALPMALASLPTLCIVGFTVLVMLPTMNRFFGPQPTEMLNLLEMLYQPNPAPESRLADPNVRQAMETYVAGRHGTRLRDAGFWDSPLMQGVSARLRTTAAGVAARHPSVSPDELTRASEVIAPELQSRRLRRESISDISGFVIMFSTATALLPVLLLSALSSLIVPGGIFTRLLGHAVIRSDGSEIGRTLSMIRVLIAWAPAIAWLLYLASSPRVQGFVPSPPSPLLGAMLTLGGMAIGAILTIARPARGPHDWLLGTRVVPR
jgi:eukaryotic-like serine/threonine-protein kinase